MPWTKEEENDWKQKWAKAEVDENRAYQEELMDQWFNQSRKSPKFRKTTEKGNIGDKKIVKNSKGITSVRYLNKKKDGTLYWGIINPLKVKKRNTKNNTKTKQRKRKTKKSKVKKSKTKQTKSSKKKTKRRRKINSKK